MALPLQVQLFDSFLGTQEGIHSIILPDVFSSGGSKNVYIDKFARVSSILGYDAQNSSAFTTNTGGSTVQVVGVIPYRRTSGGSITRKTVLVLDDLTNEWEIWVSSDEGATASFLYDAGATAVGMIPDSAQFGDDLFITNGKAVPRVYDGSSIAAVGLTQSPTPTSAESSSSGNLTGSYRYKLVSLIDGERQAGSASSTELLVTAKQVDLSWTADADTDVDGYEIYRTTGNGTTFYYLTTIDGRTTVAYTDNISDLTLLEQRVLEEHGDNPPTCYFCETHKSRMWWLRTDTNPTIGYWSDAGDPESVYSENFLNFSDSETVGDVITGALGNFDGLLVVFTEKAIWTVSGSGAIIGDFPDFTKTRTNATTGSVSGRSVLRIPAGSRYTDQEGQFQTTSESAIAYFTPLGDIRLFDGDNDLIISHPLRETVREFSYSNRNRIWAMIDSENDQAIWFFATTAGTAKAAVWNYRYGVWYVWESMPFAHGAEVDAASDAAKMLVGGTNSGYVYHFFTGSSFDGANIETQWMTKTLYGVNEEKQPAVSHRKRWRWLDILFKVVSGIDVTVEWLSGGATDSAVAIDSVIITPDGEQLFTSEGSEILTADGSEIFISAETAQRKAFLHDASGDYLHHEGIRIRVKTNTTSGPWALEAFQLAYQILPGLKRRDQ